MARAARSDVGKYSMGQTEATDKRRSHRLDPALEYAETRSSPFTRMLQTGINPVGAKQTLRRQMPTLTVDNAVHNARILASSLSEYYNLFTLPDI
jgi:hypothetical protein